MKENPKFKIGQEVTLVKDHITYKIVAINSRIIKIPKGDGSFQEEENFFCDLQADDNLIIKNISFEDITE